MRNEKRGRGKPRAHGLEPGLYLGSPVHGLKPGLGEQLEAKASFDHNMSRSHRGRGFSPVAIKAALAAIGAEPGLYLRSPVHGLKPGLGEQLEAKASFDHNMSRSHRGRRCSPVAIKAALAAIGAEPGLGEQLEAKASFDHNMSRPHRGRRFSPVAIKAALAAIGAEPGL